MGRDKTWRPIKRPTRVVRLLHRWPLVLAVVVMLQLSDGLLRVLTAKTAGGCAAVRDAGQVAVGGDRSVFLAAAARSLHAGDGAAGDEA